MSGSTFGTLFTITTFGESHGDSLGVVIDGCPAGLPLSAEDIQIFLDRRKPGQNSISTPRKESDAVSVLSGIFEGQTTGTPIALVVKNTSQKSSDYSQIASCYRPGHADYTFDCKYGFRDYRGGGRSSGRETIGRVAAGAIASKILEELGIHVFAYTKSIGPIEIEEENFLADAARQTETCMPDFKANERALSYLKECISQKDSVGGVIECRVTGLPAGIGDPVFEKLDANLSKAVMSIGAVKAVEIGDGIQVSSRKGSENNDCFFMDGNTVQKKTNHSGGILGGISDGSPVLVRAHIKPTPSIFREQDTVTRQHENTKIAITGRHDPVIVPRAVVVVESMVAITILDALMKNMGTRLSYLKSFYSTTAEDDKK